MAMKWDNYLEIKGDSWLLLIPLACPDDTYEDGDIYEYGDTYADDDTYEDEDGVLISRFSQLLDFRANSDESHGSDENDVDDEEDNFDSDRDEPALSPDELYEDASSNGRSVKKCSVHVGAKRKGKKQQDQNVEDDGNNGDEFVGHEYSKKRKVKKSPVALCVIQRILCCSLLCLCKATTESIKTLRETFVDLTTTMQSQFVLDWLWSHHQLDQRTGQYKYLFMIGIVEVCLDAWLLVLGFSKSTYYLCRSRFLKGERVVMPRGRLSCGLKLGVKGSKAVAWLRLFAERHADKIPDKLKLFLPSCLNRKDVYQYFVIDMQKQGETEEDIVCKSYFFHLWRTDVLLRNITIPKASRFSLCDTCMLLKSKLASTKTPPKASTIKLRDLHLQEQNEERRKYYKHTMKAKRNPKDYLSLIVDGMDQAKTNLPHFVELSKTVGSMWRLKVHVTGVIAHGIGHFGFFDLHQWPHGSSLTISIIQNVLKMLQEVPRVLYLQMDNCWKENKNRFLMGYLCHLVEEKVFDKIKLSFLMVGHTHEDVDQMFSRFSTALKKRACLTLPKLMACFEESFNPTPQAVLLNEVFNIGDWMFPNLDKMWGHSGPHVYKIMRDENGRARITFKDWSTDKIWKRTAEPLIKQKLNGEPKQLQPNYNEDEMSFLQEGVKKAFKFFRREEDKEWWEELFRKGGVEDGSLATQFGVDQINLVSPDTESIDVEEEEDEELKKIKMKSTPIPPVTVISGKDGSVLWTLDSSYYEMNSDLVIQTSEAHRDLFLFKMKGRGSPYRHMQSGEIIREGDVKREKRHGEEYPLPAPKDQHYDKSYFEKEYRKLHITCDDDLTNHRGEIFLVDRSSMKQPLKILDIPLKNTWYDAPVVEPMSTSSVDNNKNRNNQGQPPSPVGSQIPYQESSGSDGPMRDPRGNITVYEKMCVLMDSDDRSTGAVADLDGDGELEYISIYTSFAQTVDSRYSFYKMMFTYSIKVVNLNLLSDNFRSISVPSASSFTLNQPLKDMRTIHMLPYSNQKWNQYMGKHGDSHYRDQD